MQKVFIDPANINRQLVEKAARVIGEGGIAALPTETVYGLAGLAAEEEVRDRLYALKKRPKDKPFSLALGRPAEAVEKYFSVLPPFGYRLIEKFWPGPLTIIYYTGVSGEEKVGIRVPAHPVTAEILRRLNKAVYLPSANISGEKEAVSAAEVEVVFGEKVDLIVEGGECKHSRPSTLVDLTCSPFRVLREGAVSENEIAAVFMRKRILFVCTGNSCRSPLAAFILEKYLQAERVYFEQRYEISSRGIAAVSGAKMSAPAAEILTTNENLNGDNFRAQRLDRNAVLSADLIFTMEDNQREYILNFEPAAEGRVFNLKQFLPSQLAEDIPDPLGGGYPAYQKAYSLIKTAVLELRDWL